jgi:hypothetical protein
LLQTAILQMPSVELRESRREAHEKEKGEKDTLDSGLKSGGADDNYHAFLQQSTSEGSLNTRV